MTAKQANKAKADVSRNHAATITAAVSLCGTLKGLLQIRAAGVEPCNEVWALVEGDLMELRNALGLNGGHK